MVGFEVGGSGKVVVQGLFGWILGEGCRLKWRELLKEECWVAVVIRWSFRTVLGGGKAVGWWKQVAGCWVRLGGQLGEV